jgi:hypothetical protein
MTQDPQTRRGIVEDAMQRRHPRAHAYLARHEELLRSRAAFKRYHRPSDSPWSMFNVSGYTFADWKVVWREQSAAFTVAVVGPLDGKPVVPDHKLMMVEARGRDEAHYLCAALASAPARFAVAAYAVEISVSTHVLDHVAVPRFSAKNPLHKRLAKLSIDAHDTAASGDSARRDELQLEVDRSAAALWGLTGPELAEIYRALADQ